MSARIPPAEPPFSNTVRRRLDQLMPEGVPPLALFTTLANDERLFERFMGGGLLDKGHLGLRQREIVIDRVTARCGSEYEWGIHVAFFAKRVDLTDQQLHALVHGDGSEEFWQKDEALLVQACDALLDHCDLDDNLWQALGGVFSNAAILEIIMLTGFYRNVSCLTNAMRLPLEKFAVGFPEQT